MGLYYDKNQEIKFVKFLLELKNNYTFVSEH